MMKEPYMIIFKYYLSYLNCVFSNVRKVKIILKLNNSTKNKIKIF